MKKNNLSAQKILSREERQKILSIFMMKHTIFGQFDDKNHADVIKNFILDHTDEYTEADMSTLINTLVNEYQRRKAEYHRQSLIQKDFILAKIKELREEDQRKGNSSYFNYHR